MNEIILCARNMNFICPFKSRFALKRSREQFSKCVIINRFFFFLFLHCLCFCGNSKCVPRTHAEDASYPGEGGTGRGGEGGLQEI